jgi:uncharacterized protein YndB with AHSA1/START domain
MGTFGMTADGRCALLFERQLNHSPAKVWRALTETDQLRAWFVEIIDYVRLDLTPGARLDFYLKPGFGDVEAIRGEVVRAEPPHLLEFTWDDETLKFELAPTDGGCRLVFTNIFDDRDAASALGAGWHAGLDRLTALLDGRTADGETIDALQREYESVL